MKFTLKVTRCCYLLTLKQGTILIAIADLAFMSFLLFLLLLGGSHLQEISSMADEDLKEIESSHWSLESDFLQVNNEKKMHLGKHLVTVTMLLIYISVSLVSVHFISCVLLLYGVTRNIPVFLIPWAFIVMASLILHTISLFVFAFLPNHLCKMSVNLAGGFVIIIELYSWIVVFSYFKKLTHSQSCGPPQPVTTIVTSPKNELKIEV